MSLINGLIPLNGIDTILRKKLSVEYASEIVQTYKKTNPSNIVSITKVSEIEIYKELRKIETNRLVQTLNQITKGNQFNHFETHTKLIFETILKYDLYRVTIDHHLAQSYMSNTGVPDQTATIDVEANKEKDLELDLSDRSIHGHETEWMNITHGEFKCKSLVIECKNYFETKIDTKQIQQLHEYIHPSKNGYLGIMLNRKGWGNLTKEGKRTLYRYSKDGYLFLVLGNTEIKQLIDEYKKIGSCIEKLLQTIREYRSKITDYIPISSIGSTHCNGRHL